MRFVTEAEVAAVLELPQLIELMRTTMIDFSAGRSVQPVRARMAHERGLFMSMPAYTGALGMKVLTFSREHPMQAVMVMFDAVSGAPTALMEAETITALRTAAVSAVATDLLAPAEVSVLTIMGTGLQARSHIEALRCVRQFDEVRVWGRTPPHAERLADEMNAKAVLDPATAVRDADVVATVTGAREPILFGAWLSQGAHVNAVGAPSPTWRELDDAAMRGRLYVDSVAGAVEESGDVIGSGAEVYAEIGAALAGEVEVDPHESTIFKSLGMGIQDVATADYVLTRL